MNLKILLLNLAIFLLCLASTSSESTYTHYVSQQNSKQIGKHFQNPVTKQNQRHIYAVNTQPKTPLKDYDVISRMKSDDKIKQKSQNKPVFYVNVTRNSVPVLKNYYKQYSGLKIPWTKNNSNLVIAKTKVTNISIDNSQYIGDNMERVKSTGTEPDQQKLQTSRLDDQSGSKVISPLESNSKISEIFPLSNDSLRQEKTTYDKKGTIFPEFGNELENVNSEPLTSSYSSYKTSNQQIKNFQSGTSSYSHYKKPNTLPSSSDKKDQASPTKGFEKSWETQDTGSYNYVDELNKRFEDEESLDKYLTGTAKFINGGVVTIWGLGISLVLLSVLATSLVASQGRRKRDSPNYLNMENMVQCAARFWCEMEQWHYDGSDRLQNQQLSIPNENYQTGSREAGSQTEGREAKSQTGGRLLRSVNESSSLSERVCSTFYEKCFINFTLLRSLWHRML